MTTREDAVHERTHQIGSLIAHSWLVVKNSLLLRLLLGLLFLGWFRLLLPVSRRLLLWRKAPAWVKPGRAKS
jgi:hypothetical protein